MSSNNKRNTNSNETDTNLLIDLTNQNLDFEPFLHPFLSGEYGDGCPPQTLIELTMMKLSGAIRSKVNWYEKMKDQTIRNKWKDEALARNLLSAKQIDYVLAELDYYNSIRDQSMEMSAVDGVWQSDQLISNDIKQLLMQFIQNLEDIPENEKDWHPGTNQQVLDLVHPSLFCYVNELSRIINEKNRTINCENALEHIGVGEMIDINFKSPESAKRYPSYSSDYTKSKTYQWLPTEFHVSKEGQVKIESYINNLHPIEHKQLYAVIEQVFQRFIPLFNKTLTDLAEIKSKPPRIQVDPYSWYDESNAPDFGDDVDDDAYNDYQQNRPLIIPDVQEFQMPTPKTSTIDLRGRKLQVIVKLANIILTPENSQYAGGVWHVEGMENEHIVTTGIYYYHSSNITQSDLQFRTVVCEPNYEQNDDRGVNMVYGLTNDGPLNQALGEVITQEDRCIVFPNIYQHRVAPFQLQDSTQIGERKILVFFLVDPSIRILSTANIPPQQSHWLVKILRSITRFKNLPALVLDRIISFINFPMSMKEAKEHREKLMVERKYFILQNNESLFERPFSLCEH